MRLELADFPVKEARFGEKTAYSGGRLEIHKEELLELVRKDGRIAFADLDLAFPGEKTRIVNGRDAVEPRVKVSGPGGVFPGIIGPVETVGEGRTHRLSGTAVIASADYAPTVFSGTGAKNSALLDMWGEGAKRTPLSRTINLVLILRLAEGVSEWEAHATIQEAEFKVAVRLAEATRELVPPKLEVMELKPVDPALPRVLYIVGCITEAATPHSSTALYGLPIKDSMPTFMHPNEFFDGAVTTDARRGYGSAIYTWMWMNHPLILGLYEEHGKRLNFLGVIFQRTRFETELGKQVTAAMTSQMARLLGAQGAIFTRMTESGNNLMDVMLTVQACERKGIRAVFVTPEYSGNDGTEPPMAFATPEATGMVSTGSSQQAIRVERPDKVIGVEKGQGVQLLTGDPLLSPWGELVLEQGRYLFGWPDWFGYLNFTGREY